MQNNIILIGMPASGKSTVGVILAKILGYRFIDTDIVIQHTEGCLLSQIIENEGIDGFIETENHINSSIITDKSVIATGGSAIYGKDAMKHFHDIGTIVYLSLDFQTLSERLGNIKNRGVVIKENQTLLDLYNERVPLYEKYADIIINEGNSSVEDTIKLIIEKLQ